MTEESPNYVTMGLTSTSTREEVLAAVEEHERRAKASLEWIAANPISGPGCRRYDPDAPLTGDKLLLERQKTAGEEDQTVPGWDQGA